MGETVASARATILVAASGSRFKLSVEAVEGSPAMVEIELQPADAVALHAVLGDFVVNF
jgi:hypothetical protein